MKISIIAILLLIIPWVYIKMPIHGNVHPKPSVVDLIDSVPITNIPIGWNKVNSIDSLKYSFDYEHLELANSLCILEIDSINKHGLNHIFKYNTLPIRNQENQYLLAEPKKMIFAKRLPDIRSQRMLIYYVQMQKKESEIILPCWLLIKVSENGTPADGYIIAGVDWGENDSLAQTLYYISQDYTLHTRSFANYSEEVADDEGNLTDVITKNEDYIYASPVTAISLAEEL